MNVTVNLTGTLVARTGTREARVAVPEDATVADVVEELAERYGPQVRAGLLDVRKSPTDDFRARRNAVCSDGGQRLRSDTVVVRESFDATETLSTASSLENGDTVRFELNV